MSLCNTNNTLSSIATPAGRLVPVLYNGQVHWKTEYNLTDQTSTTLSSGLGNVRVVFAAHTNGQPEVMQQTSYYPFGYTLQQNDFSAGVTSENKNLYNGKLQQSENPDPSGELQNDVLAGSRLVWYDYGARFYDPDVGKLSFVYPYSGSNLLSIECMAPPNTLLVSDLTGSGTVTQNLHQGTSTKKRWALHPAPTFTE